jgi:copper chaperone CopZ
MTLLVAILPLLRPVDDDSFTVTLSFERMHCDECKAELDASLKRMSGVRLVTFIAGSAVVVFDEKSAVPAFNRLPKDLSLRTITLAIRGTVSFAGEKATLVARSGSTYALVNADRSKTDHLGDLKRKMGTKARFHVTGTIGADGKTVALQSFQTTDWKD